MRATTVLGLDFGERRIGVALSDPEKIMASGLMTIDCRRNPGFLDTLGRIVMERKVEAIVVGYPIRTDGKPGEKTKVVDEFIAELERRFQLPVHREDESYTTQLAQESLMSRKKKKKVRMDKGEIDRVAACFILQDFLNRLESTR